MLRRTVVSLLALGLFLPALSAAQDTRPGIAVMPFQNGGSYGQDKENFDALERGIAGMLISELSQNPAARVVERENVQRLLDEQDLGADGGVDAATAAKVGKLVGARYMVMSTFVASRPVPGGRAPVDVETSEILKWCAAIEAREAGGDVRLPGAGGRLMASQAAAALGEVSKAKATSRPKR
jgi:hypothetical protein